MMEDILQAQRFLNSSKNGGIYHHLLILISPADRSIYLSIYLWNTSPFMVLCWWYIL